MSLDDPRIDKLVSLIKNSFRVRPNHDPVYVDIGEHLERLAAKQHQVVFGRRGSGKSCLLVHYHRRLAGPQNVLSIYVDTDEIKTLPYPDLLIRLLLTIGERLESSVSTLPARMLRRAPAKLVKEMKELRKILDQAESAKISKGYSSKAASRVGGTLHSPVGEVGGELAAEEAASITADFTAKKVETLERHLQDYKNALVDAINRSKFSHAAIIVDDFYLISPQWQPQVIDYLHRLCRGTELYLKIGTVRHRTTLVRYDGGQTIGVEIAQDVEGISLDQTFEDIDATRRYLTRMLDSMADKVDLQDFCNTQFSEEGLLALTLASGGVPRDFLTIFVEAADAARDIGAKRLTPRTIYKGAGRVSYQTKLSYLRGDVGPDAARLEAVLQDLNNFCLRETKKTAFLIAQDEVAKYPDVHELIQELMDFKLVHVIEPDTSAASGRSGRYEAYTLDFALFMEPRLRNIEHVEFWKTDENYRRKGIREAPVYSLERARAIVAAGGMVSTEKSIDSIRAEVGVEDEAAIPELDD